MDEDSSGGMSGGFYDYELSYGKVPGEKTSPSVVSLIDEWI